MPNFKSQAQGSEHGLTAEDIAALSNYPSLGKILDGNNSVEFARMREKLSSTFQNLERVTLRGSSEDSLKSRSAATAFKIAIDFLDAIKQGV